MMVVVRRSRRNNSGVMRRGGLRRMGRGAPIKTNVSIHLLHVETCRSRTIGR